MTGIPGMKPAPGPDQPPIPVRLVTFNTHHGVGEDARHDLVRLAKVLASADADVICLQEVDRHFGDRSEDVDQALLLSRLPILISDVQRLPGGGEPRSALRTMLELDGGTLWVTATHLTTHSPEERGAQASCMSRARESSRAWSTSSLRSPKCRSTSCRQMTSASTEASSLARRGRS